jgi:hypothetical protein
MAEACPSVPIVPGHNSWLLARTDRDAPSHEDVIQTAGAVLHRFLGNASPVGQRGVFDVLSSPQSNPGEGRFIIGAARPAVVRAARVTDPSLALKEMPRLLGTQLANYMQCGTHPTITAQLPWYVVVSFDWRGPAVRIPWPRRAVNWAGLPSHDQPHGNDWLLVAATHQGAPREPDTSLAGEVGDYVGDGAKSAATTLQRQLGTFAWVLGGAAVLFGASWLINEQNKRQKRLSA